MRELSFVLWLSHSAHVTRPQRTLPGHRFAQLLQQSILVFRQVACQRERIGGVVGAEDDGLRWVEAADQSFLFLQYREVVRHGEGFAELALEFFRDAVVEIELQGGKVGDRCAVEQREGAVYVFVAVLRAAQAEDHGGGDFHAAVVRLVQHFAHAPLRGALGDLFQDEVGTALDADIEQAQLVLAQLREVFRALALQVARRGIAGDAREARQCSGQFAQEGEQVVGGQGQRIAIGKEHAVRVRPVGRSGADVGADLLQRALDILLAAIHRAEAALVEAAAQRGLDDEVVALGGWAI